VDAVVVAVADHEARRERVLVLSADLADFPALLAHTSNGRRISIRQA
jgi:hypothetical protein